MEELIAKYAGAYDSDFEMPETPSESEESDMDEPSEEEESKGEIQQQNQWTAYQSWKSFFWFGKSNVWSPENCACFWVHGM